MKQDIKEFTLKELEDVLENWGKPSFHAKQIFAWLYKKGVKDFEEMSDLPSDLRKRLKERFYLFGLKLIRGLESCDGTEKFLFELRDGNLIEAVSIPAERRITGCISTQAGCKFACGFCASGLSGFKRNLTAAEMIEQAMQFKFTHLVFMGIGEPLDNYDNVIKAIRIINSPQGLHIGARRITISTCGITPGIKRLSDEGLQIELSISLHAADGKTRSRLMPVNKKYPLKDLIKACAEYIKKTNRQITFEYILIKGINSDLQSAGKLGRLLKGLNCKINIIPANPIKELKIELPEHREILLFRDYLLKHGINVTLRRPRGQDIEASCGQLRLRYEKK
jgi:23S rRNA (adenine2503-C2)-methyltransferase